MLHQLSDTKICFETFIMTTNQNFHAKSYIELSSATELSVMMKTKYHPDSSLTFFFLYIYISTAFVQKKF